MFINTIKSLNSVLALTLVVLLFAAACSSGASDGADSTLPVESDLNATTTDGVTSFSRVSTSTTAAESSREEVSVIVPFTSGNGSGYMTVSGDASPVAEWFANQPGEVSLDLIDADVTDPASVVEEMISFWFFQDDDSGDVPPSIYVSASGDIADSVGTRYVVEAQGLPPAPVAETTTTTSSMSTTSASTSSVPETSEPPSSATSSTTTSTSSTTTTTTTVVESPAILQVQVLNGSGVAGAAGRLTDKLSEAGYVVLSPANAPQRYSSSAVYYQEGWQDKAEEILQAAEIEEIDIPTAMPQIFASEEAAVIVLLGTDTAPAVAREQAGLRPRQRNDVRLPLPDSTPRDRYVPGLANVNIYTPENDNDPQVFLYIDTLARALGSLGTFADERWSPVSPRAIEARTTEKYQTAIEAIEQNLEWLGFTPQNTCGAPAGYSFADLLQPTREWDDNLKTYGGDAIFTTDGLLELHGGERINPEANLDFYINQAVQTAHDALRIPELAAETEAMQLILCQALVAPSGEVPEAANSLWYANLTPGIQPRESLLSQGTYHLKEISRNGNRVQIVVCHPTLGSRYIAVWWRDAGYRAEATGSIRQIGCQAHFEANDYISEHEDEPSFTFSFGERVFSAGDMQGFPRS